MAQLAFGVAGAFVGSLFGPIGTTIGWSIGSYLGGALFGKGQEGPRLSDLKLQASTYGAPIPLLYGTIRVAGNVIWQTDLVEHSHRSSGKGGPQNTTYSYTASFAVLLCEGPIIGVKRIWADSRLIYPVAGSASAIPLTLYLGTETQAPDPTMEAHLGVGNVPAYRGRALAVFTDWELGDFGNRIPNLTFEIHATGNNELVRVSTWRTDGGAGTFAYPYELAGMVLDGGVITRYQYRSPEDYGPPLTGWGPVRDVATFDLYGNEIGTGTSSQLPDSDFSGPYAVSGTGVALWQAMNADIAYVQWTIFGATISDDCDDGGGDTRNLAGFLMGGGIAEGSTTEMCGGSGAGKTLGIRSALYYHNGFVYAAGGTAVTDPDSGGTPSGRTWVRRWAVDIANGRAQRGYSDSYQLTSSPDDDVSGTTVDVTVSDDGFVYVLGRTAAPHPQMWKLTLDLDVVQHWADIGVAVNSGDGSFSVVQGYLLFWKSAGLVYSDDAVFMYAIDSLPPSAEDAYQPAAALETPLIYIGDGYMAGRDGIFRLDSYTTLGAIVADISARVGLDSSEYDVSDLPDRVRGFAVTQQMTGRSAIEALMPSFNFGGVESDTEIKFRHFGKPSSVTIADEDLGARGPEAEPVSLLSTIRIQEEELPRRIYVKYLNAEADYQDGTQLWQRAITSSRLDATISAPIVFTDAEAKAIADRLGSTAWIERERHTFFTPRKFVQYEPIDVATIQGREMRITGKDEQQSGIVKWDAVASLEASYVQAPPATSGGFVPPDVPTLQETDLVLLDIPLVGGADYPNGFYAAMAGRASTSWPGAQIFKSLDGGSSYESLLSSNAADTIGSATTVLGAWTGGNFFDELNSVTVRLTWGSGTLASVTELAVLNGANLAVLGAEIIQYKTATLVSAGVYTLTGLLRGRRGTEWAIGTHAIDDRFVVLPSSINIDGPFGEIGLARYYKAVTAGSTLTASEAQSFANTGVAIKPFAPAHLRAGRDAAGNITINWVRRSRVPSADNLAVLDIPLGESTELYQLTIYASGTYATVKRQGALAISTASYSSADQTTDFGGTQATIYAGVAQYGSGVVGYETRGAL